MSVRAFIFLSPEPSEGGVWSPSNFSHFTLVFSRFQGSKVPVTSLVLLYFLKVNTTLLTFGFQGSKVPRQKSRQGHPECPFR